MSSCLLFHGPGARAAAVAKAESLGRLLAPPFGEDGGLKTEEAREAVSVLLDGPPGDSLGVIIIGPMDEAVPKACDVLLKRIEEFRGDLVQPILWAHDAGGVPSTIRSRCLSTWSPSSDVAMDEELRAAAWEAIETSLADDHHLLPAIVDRFKGKEQDALGFMAEAISTRLGDGPSRELWARIREVSQWRNPQGIEILAALLGEG